MMYSIKTEPVMDEFTGLGTGTFRTIVFKTIDDRKTISDIYEFDGNNKKQVAYVKRSIKKNFGLAAKL